MDTVRWRLKDYLQEHDLTEEALVRASNLSSRLVHALTVEEAEQVRLETLAGLLGGLRVLPGTELVVSAALLASGTADLQAQLDDLERDVPPGELDTWLRAFYTAASKNTE